MSTFFKGKISEESEPNENYYSSNSNNSPRKPVRKKWCNFGTDRNDIQSECSRVFDAIQKLAKSSGMSEGNEKTSESHQARKFKDEDDSTYSVETYIDADGNGNFKSIGEIEPLDNPNNSTSTNDDQTVEETKRITNISDPNGVEYKDNNNNTVIIAGKNSLAPTELSQRTKKSQKVLPPPVEEKETNISWKSIQRKVSSTSTAGSSNKSILKQSKCPSKELKHQIKPRCSRPTIQVFERKLSSNLLRDKSPYACDHVFGLENMKTSKVHVSFKNYNLLTKTVSNLKKNSSSSVCSTEQNKKPVFLTCTNDIIPLWSLDVNNKSRLPYPRTSISSQYTQTDSGSECKIDVSQSVSDSFLLGEFGHQNPLISVAKDMKEAIYAATEAGVALMNTVFKSDLGNPKATSVITTIPEFARFINSNSEIEAVEKIAYLYELASQRIKQYELKLKSSAFGQVQFPQNPRFFQTISKILNVSPTDVKMTNTKDKKTSRALPIWSFDCDMSPEKFDLSFTSHSGELHQIVTYDQRAYRTIFTGSPNEINVLSRATYENSIPAQLRPQIILQIIEKICSFVNGRIIATKYCCAQVANRFCPIAQHFLDGKYTISLKRRKFPHFLKKFRAINVTSGVAHQLASDLLKACSALHKIFGQQIGLEAILIRSNNIPGILIEEAREINIPVSAKLDATETIRSLQSTLKDLATILETGETTLRFLEEDTTTNKIKRKYRTTINILLNGLRQLSMTQDMDFGTLVMTLSCNARLFENLAELIPSVDKTTRFKIISNITQFHWGIGQLLQSVKSIQTITKFISENSCKKMQFVNAELKNKQIAKDQSIRILQN